MSCPVCGAEIPEDSFFCDQCGDELRICPRCGRPGKRNWCIHDGEALVAARELALRDGAGAESAAGERPSLPDPRMSRSGDSAEPLECLRIRSPGHHLDLEVRPGTVVGRKSGAWTAVFSSFPDVSGIHARFDYSPLGGWTVTDLGSTNGTFSDGKRIPSHRPERLRDGIRLTFGSLEMLVSLGEAGESANSSTVRLR